MRKRHLAAAAAAFVVSAPIAWWVMAQTPPVPPSPSISAQQPAAVVTVPGMPGVPDPVNLYSEVTADRMSPAVAGALERVYVPNRSANTVSVIDPATLKVIDTFKVGVH